MTPDKRPIDLDIERYEKRFRDEVASARARIFSPLSYMALAIIAGLLISEWLWP